MDISNFKIEHHKLLPVREVDQNGLIRIFGGWWKGKCGSTLIHNCTVCGSRGRRLEEYNIGTGVLTSRGVSNHWRGIK